MPCRKKIGLIGAGNIGGELARLCAEEELGDVVLFDVAIASENLREGQGARPGAERRPSSATGFHVRGTVELGAISRAPTSSSITAGMPRKPGQSRDDLVATNLPIIRDVADNAKQHVPGRALPLSSAIRSTRWSTNTSA